jgi:hypothetical protein
VASIKQIGKSFKDRLLKRYFVRWHMSAILAATVASGLLLDRTFLYFDFDAMGWRYALSVLGAYGFFFLLVRMWVWYAAGVAVQLSLPGLRGDVVEAADFLPGSISGEAGFAGFHGGDAGGGGASDLFDAPLSSTSGGGAVDLDSGIDFDDGFWILLVLAVLIIIVAGAGGYLIWMAPEILPEVALECAVGAGLVRQLKSAEAGWAGRLLRKTWIPLLIVMAVAYFVGVFIQGTCPGATHVRAALHCASTQ